MNLKICSIVGATLLTGCVHSNSGMPNKPSKVEDEASVVGTIVAYLGDGTALDEHWVVCDGRSLPIDDDFPLFKVIGWRYGFGNDITNFTTFALPDLRGSYIRGVDLGSQNDWFSGNRTISIEGHDISAGDVPGSVQREIEYYAPNSRWNAPLEITQGMRTLPLALGDLYAVTPRNVSANWIIRVK
jgi:hypothetical protein